MRIAQVAPLAESVPPEGYGGTERVVSYLTEELVRLGHDVVRGAGQAAIDAGDVPNAMRAAERMHNMLPDGMRMTVNRRDMMHA